MFDALSYTAGDAASFYRCREGAIKFVAQRLHLTCQGCTVDIAARADLHDLVRDVESRHYRDAIDALRARIATHFTHFSVEVRRGGNQAWALFRCACDEKFAVENADCDRCGVAHALFSSER